QVQTVATTATGLTCFIFRFLRRPHHGNKGYKDLFHGWVSGVFIPEQSMLITEKAFDLRAG
ncbi:hypothetical protein QIG09_25445, partial [Klebsiella pneumoniae]|nr:hypothetical protein [Klebsiella pneumoniae]